MLITELLAKCFLFFYNGFAKC